MPNWRRLHWRRDSNQIASGKPGAVQSPSVVDVCAKLEVSDRALRLCCNEHLGIGPHRYLHLRQLHLTRRALRYSSPGVTRVSDVARRYGFGGSGRFSAAYREQFGELPSETIRRR